MQKQKKEWRLSKFVESHKKLIAILLIAFSVIIGFVCAKIQYSSGKISTFSESWYYTSQIVSSIFMTSGVIIAVWQYYLSSKSMKNDLEVIQVQRAIDLAEYYKDNILKYYPAIRYVFEKTGILDIMNKLRIEQLQDFDEHEIKSLFSQSDINELKKLQKSDVFYQSVLEANFIYELGLNIPAKKEKVKGDDDKEYVTLEFNKSLITLAFMVNLVKDVLNNLEYFALHFHHNTADESVVYQSLHQTYLEIVHVLYYSIAITNKDSTEKYFTNIIWLFERWRDTKSEKNSERSIKSKEIQSHGTVVGK